jgi:hypothetical protein
MLIAVIMKEIKIKTMRYVVEKGIAIVWPEH